MRRIRSKDTTPELLVRRLVHKLGYRFRLHRKDLPGKPDLTFPSKKKVIFVHGCFWHSHESPDCKIAHTPCSNKSYWIPKLEKTVARDKKNQTLLQKKGWKFLIIWECETKNFESICKKITGFLSDGDKKLPDFETL